MNLRVLKLHSVCIELDYIEIKDMIFILEHVDTLPTNELRALLENKLCEIEENNDKYA